MLRLLFVVLLALAGCDSGPRDSPATVVLNINQATVKDLERLPGIGDVRARSIIASRNARGGSFATYDEIEAIDGIGPITMQKIRPYITLGPPNPK
jgi:competence protein ComEA